MIINKCHKAAFSVIGKMGSTDDGPKFVAGLWMQANAEMNAIIRLAKRDKKGIPVGCWGLRSDFGKQLAEWEDGRGLYLAGVEVPNSAAAPAGFEKWDVPASNYVSVKVDGEIEDAVREVKEYTEKAGLDIAGAYFEYMNIVEPGLILFFPVKDKEKFVFPPRRK